MGANINDVARVAGVSASTVSRSLSGGPVNETTRAAVVRAAESVGYRPNRAARELITGRTGALGLLVPDLGNPYFAEVIKGASSRARAAGYPIFIADTDEDRAREHEILTSLRQTTDGILICSPRSTDDELLDIASQGPTVMINRQVPGVPSVMGDAASGIEQAVQHLGALGHRRIAYVSGPPGSSSDARRGAGVGIAESLGIEVVRLPSAAPTFHSGVLAGDLLLTTGATAVIAFNDLMAIGILNRLVARGVRVPEDISLVGHDDIPMATMCTPHLTTVAVRKEHLGRMATELLLRILSRNGDAESETDAQDQDIQIASNLVVRGSSGVAPVAAPLQPLVAPHN